MRQPTGNTHATRAQIELRKRILSGDLPGGTRLFEVQMAEQLDISRTPVRDAMSRLVEEGLLDRARGGGFVVRSFSFGDVIDAIELRGVLEGTAARLAAERGAGEQALQRIQEIVAELDKCFGPDREEVDFERYADLNARFHHELAGLSGSEIVRREVERVTGLPFASPSAFLPNSAEIEAFTRSLYIAQEQHRQIIAAIAGRESSRAEALAREHARTARRNLDYVLAEDRSLMKHLPGLALVKD
ncbi:GntR family transcriptional regulator [Nitratireductor mangrovi]|uniref:GntR family transcriptional regulator n=1 Tax=Nitratireductor mangrovi TaxID=2599600 RepID=A0A5B8L343_9HYPH|nr:GntR family transcriptional regulator [Nitratireductor mangrovi]QDZ02263.1 GntR family transcriptional regulator [Nitratireductor mangrovi]